MKACTGRRSNGSVDSRRVLGTRRGARIRAAPRARAQDLGIQVGTTAPAAKVQTLDGKEADLAQYIGKTPVAHGVLGDVVPELQGARADAASRRRRSTARR